METKILNHMRIVMLLGLSAMMFVSCDTRENIFEEIEKNGVVVVKSADGRTDTLSFSQNNAKTNYDFHVERVDHGTMYFDTLWLDYFFVREKVGEKSFENIYPPRLLGTTDQLDLPISYPLEQGSNKWEGCNKWADYDLWITTNERHGCFDSDTAAKKVSTIRLEQDLWVRWGHEVRVYFTVTLWGDCPPMPVLEVSDVEGHPMERVLSLKKSYDKDGEVKKYEYCIDGNVVEYQKTDDRFESKEGIWQGGKAAYGGTYIIATDKDEVKHAFQTEGRHMIYYRCMDNLGAWSTWRSEEISVNRK